MALFCTTRSLWICGLNVDDNWESLVYTYLISQYHEEVYGRNQLALQNRRLMISTLAVTFSTAFYTCIYSNL